MIYKTLYKKLKIEQHEHHKNWGWIQVSWRVDSPFVRKIDKLYYIVESGVKYKKINQSIM
jgi:hypothetical protein